MSVDLNDPIIKEALELAWAFANFCRENNLPKTLILDGVAFSAAVIALDAKQKGFIEGKAYERGRIATLLGVDK